MRLYLLPISTRRTLLYCQKLNVATTEQKTLVDKATTRATKLWADWEKKEKGWQKTVVTYGNHALRRISYEEWGLKSVPPLSTKRRQEELTGKDKVQVVYPETVIPTSKALGVLQTLGTEREQLHRSRLIWCLVGMPISAPFALVPIVPNLPFFYLVYRAWSHWRALAGGRHVQFLSTNNLLALAPSPVLDTIYPPLLPSAEKLKTDESAPSSSGKAGDDEQLLLSQEHGRQLVKALDVPELEVEIERAIWQVENAIKKTQDEKAKSSAQASIPDGKADIKGNNDEK